MSELRKKYLKEIIPQLKKELKLSSVMAVPRLEKVVINMGMTDAITNSKRINEAMEELSLISGQKPILVLAKKSVAAFKLREKMPIAVKVTIRRDKMYVFLEKLFNIGLPGVRDFRGLNPNSFDNNANYTFGIKEHLIFPEIDYDKISKNRGMDVSLVTNTKNIDHARKLLLALGTPLKIVKEKR